MRTGAVTFLLAVLLPGLGRAAAPVDFWRGLEQGARERVDAGGYLESAPMEDLPGPRGKTRALVVETIGRIDAPPEAVGGVLRDFRGYPAWLTLNPSYKAVRVEAGPVLVCSLGRADRAEARGDLRYNVRSTGGDREGSVTWFLLEGVMGQGAGSSLELSWEPHPVAKGTTLLLQKETVLTDSGLALRYMRKEKDPGRTRYWKDARNHARRTHWAVAARAERPGAPEGEVKARYLEHYRREFGGKEPWWSPPPGTPSESQSPPQR